MLERFRLTRQAYPPQFWILFWGQLISTFGASMIWPYLMIYVSERLDLPLTAAASLMSLNAVMGLGASFIAGPIIDRTGRKWVMVISLAVNGLAYVLMNRADTLLMFAVLMGVRGAFVPLFRIGADAMMADLVPNKQRVEAYSLLRMGKNIGVALGPAIGGFIASSSYTIVFYIAASGMIAYGLLMAFFAVETLPQITGEVKRDEDRLGGYGYILKDKRYLSFVTTVMFTFVGASMLWVLLAVYVKSNYQIPERQYGIIPTTNAVMVVTLQMAITKITKRHKELWMMALGALLYALGVGSVALGSGLWSFWTSMVIMTFGELILVPTATTYAANLAPADMRGRYMSIFSLTRGSAVGIGPVIGGFMNDTVGPTAIWYSGGLIGLISTVGLILLARRSSEPQPDGVLP